MTTSNLRFSWSCAPKAPDDACAGEVFLHDRRHLAGDPQDVRPHLPQRQAHHRRPVRHDGHEEQPDKGQPPVQEEEQPSGSEHKDEDVERPQQPALHEVAQSLDVSGGAGHLVAGLLAVVVRETEPLQFVENGVAQVVRHELARPLGEVRLAVGAHAARRTDQQDEEGEFDDLGEHAAAEHLVDGVAKQARAQRGRSRCWR